MTDDPWKGIALPESEARVHARRADAASRWDFFWARSMDRRYLLVLEHAAESAPKARLPKLKGIDLTVSDYDRNRKVLVFKLQDDQQKDVFLELCRDIIRAADAAENEKDAVARALARTWRWHHLLRGGSDGRLSAEEQKGLIGELLVLQEILLPALEPLDALNTWRGPLDAPKDFEIGRYCIEAKARRSAALPCINISSIAQLDSSGIDGLFLHVVDLDLAPTGTAGSRTVTDYAARLRDLIVAQDGGAAEHLDMLLNAGGFRWSDDYSDFSWVEGERRGYRVVDGFPRLCPANVPSGVTEAKYAVGLPDCEPFRIDRATLYLECGLEEK
jgi:hypothetical protein